MRVPISLTAALCLAACSTVGNDHVAQRDPLEKFNRGIWGFNQGVDKVALKPLSNGYRAVVPGVVRHGVTNALDNLSEPWSAANNVLQLKPKRAVRNVGRFLVNTTIGIGGVRDQATKFGIREPSQDFGETLAHWGVNAGPYLVLPILGPSTVRDGFGRVVESFADPVQVALARSDIPTAAKIGFVAVKLVNARAQMTESGVDTMLATSADPYAVAHTAYLQKREAAIQHREDLDDDAAGDAPETTPPAPHPQEDLR